MKFCRDCGSAIEADQKFCVECGASLGAAKPNEASLSGADDASSTQPERDYSEPPTSPAANVEAAAVEIPDASTSMGTSTSIGTEADSSTETEEFGWSDEPRESAEATPIESILAFFAAPARILENRNAFIFAYLAGMVPTYLLPYVGSNSAILNSASAMMGFGGTIQFWLHVASFVFLFGISTIRGPKAGFAALWLFPLLAAFADFVPGLNWIPLLPSALHLIALVLGARSRHEVEDTEAPTLKLAITAAAVVACVLIGLANLSSLNDEVYGPSNSFAANEFEAPVRNFPDLQSFRDNFLSNEEEYIVTGTANIRNYPTSEGTSVVRSLNAGAHVFAREVQAFDPSSSWYKLREGGYIWSSNLQKSPNQYGENCPPWREQVNYDGTFQVIVLRRDCPYVLISESNRSDWFYVYGRKRDGNWPDHQAYNSWDTNFKGATDGFWYWRMVPKPAAFGDLEYVCLFIARRSGTGDLPSDEQLARYRQDVATSGKNCPELL